jgi:tetratricopeptide (TPR) repeat protein
MTRAKSLNKAAARNRVKPQSRARRSATAPRSGLSGNRLALLLSAGIAAVTFAIYSPVLGHGFLVLDDREYVTANTHIRGLGWETIRWAFTSRDAANWHPLTWMSHAIDYQLYALNPVGHHLSAVLIHALNAALLFLVLYWITKRMGPSLFVGGLFGLHPINVESVAWIAERKNVLSTFFFLLTIAAYAWYGQKPNWRRYLLMAALFAAGLMAKPMLVTVPFVLLLLDYWPLERIAVCSSEEQRMASSEKPLLWLVLEKVPLLLMSVASSWITLIAQRPVVQSFEEFSFGNRLGNALVAYGLYLWKMVWPAQLALYPHAIGALPAWQWMLSSAVLIAITVLVVVERGRRYLLVGWLWFLGTLVPVIGLVQVGEYAMADRYAYVSLIGIFIMIAWGAADWAEAKQLSTTACAIPAVCILAAFSGVTVHQIGYWESNYSLYSHTLAVAETPFAHNAVGMALMSPESEMTKEELNNFASAPDRIAEARRHFERALELRQSGPQGASLWDKARTLNNLGNLDRMEGRTDAARADDEAAIAIYRQLAQQNPEVYLPYLAVTLNNLAAVERRQNQLEEARRDYEQSLEINRQLAARNPDKYLANVAMVLNEYGLLDATQNRMDSARQRYQEALQINRQLAQQNPAVYSSQLAMTLENFALLDAFQGKLDDARQHYEEALRIDRQLVRQNPDVYMPDLAMTLSNLGRVDRLQGRVDEARARYEEAYGIMQKLARSNNAYADEMARVRSSLEELQRMAPSSSAAGQAQQ